MSTFAISSLSVPSLTATGNVPPCVFLSISGENTGAPTGAGMSSVGVTDGFTDRAPNDGALAAATYIATTGRPIPYKPVGCVVDLSILDTIVAGARIMSDANGFGINHATTGKLSCAIALRGGVSGEKIPVYVTAPVPYQGTYS